MKEKDFDETKKKAIEQVETKISEILNDGVQQTNVDYLYKLVDIHKDLKKDDYLEKKEEDSEMMYRGNGYGRDSYGNGSYGNDSYGRRSRDSRGRYTEGGSYGTSYGRRGVDAKYRGQEMMDEMAEHYGNYMESGQYNGKGSMEALEYMLQSAEDFFKHIKDEAKSQEEIELVKRSARRIAEM